MKYYIATGLERAKAHNIVRDALNDLGHEITYDWTVHGSVQKTSLSRLKEVGHLELQAVKDADFVVVLLPGGNGTHTEFGLTIAYNKPVFLHASDSKFLELGDETCAFYHLNHVTQMKGSVEDMVITIDQHLKENLISTR